METYTPKRNDPRTVSAGDKRKIIKALWELNSDKTLFKSFEEITGGIQAENKIGFSLHLHNNLKASLYFFARKNGHGSSTTVDTASENASGAQYLLAEDFSKDELSKILSSYLKRLNVGFAIEHKLLRRILDYLLDDSNPRFEIKYVRKATMQEDIAGVDIYLGMNGNREFPLQLKKNVHDQRAHIKRFPATPSYVFDSKLTTRETLRLFSKMAEKYFRGEVQHK